MSPALGIEPLKIEERNPKIILVADKDFAAILINDTYVGNVTEVCLSLRACEGTQLNLTTDGPVAFLTRDKQEFFADASRLLGYKLSCEG